MIIYNIKRTLTIVTLLSLIHLFNSSAEAGIKEAFLYSTVLIECPLRGKDGLPSITRGTGFLIFHKLSGDRGHVFLTTNKHMIPPEGKEEAISVRVNIKEGKASPKVKFIEIPVVGEDNKYLPHVKVHRNQDTDVAVINITKFVNQHKIKGTWLPESLFGTKAKLKAENITVGDEIFVLGYPSAIFDPRNVFPILRQGIIATVPVEGYAFNKELQLKYKTPRKIDGFLIDANIFPGSSGSLVILKQQAVTIGSGGIVVSGAKRTPYILGIVSGSIPIIDFKGKSIQRMGLGIVYSVETIEEVINYFYNNK